MPTFSVIIPLYNKKDQIKDTIQSVLDQTFKDFELIIINDGSSDGSESIARSISDSRIYVYDQENSGVSKARNIGFTFAKSDRIAFLDADDRWEPEFLSRIDSLYTRYNNAGLYASSYVIIDPDGSRRMPKLAGIPNGFVEGILPSYFKSAALGNTPVFTCAVCIPRKVFQDIRGFNENVDLYEDLDMWARIAINHDIAYCALPSATYNRKAGNRARYAGYRTRNLIGADGRYLSFEKDIDSAIDRGILSGEDARYAKIFVARYALLNAFRYIDSGNRSDARKIALSTRTNDLSFFMRKWMLVMLSFLPSRIISYMIHFMRRVKTLF